MAKRQYKVFLGKERKFIIHELTKVYGLRCWYCGARLEENGLGVNIDHIISQAEGGSDEVSNLALSCKYCNSHKLHYPVETFLNYLAYIRTGRFSCPIIERFKTVLEPTVLDILSKGFW